MSEKTLPVIVAITGASGSIYAFRTMRALLLAGRNIELIFSPSGQMVLRHELGCGYSNELISRLGEDLNLDDIDQRITYFSNEKISAPTASGSHATAGMVIVPCSMKTLAAVASGYASNLLERSADVTLKEQRPLILVTRETPLNRIHLKNQLSAAEAGATILPASPAFYQKPQSFEDLADFIAGRVLSILGIPHSLFPAWTEND